MVRDCSGRTHFEGRTDASGILRVPKALPDRDTLPSCGTEESQKEFFVTARTGDDFAYAFSNWGEGISPWRFNVPTGNWNGPYVAHAVLDRSLVRGGETVSMKLFVRQQTGSGLRVRRRARRSTTRSRSATSGSEREYTVPVAWNGAAPRARRRSPCRRTRIPAPTRSSSATRWRRTARRSRSALAGSFRVEAFRVPLLRARVQAVGAPLVDVRATSTFDVQVSYLAGGGAGGCPSTLRTQVDSKVVTFPDYEDYSVRRRRRQGGARGAGRRDRALRHVLVRGSRRWTSATARRAPRPKRGTDVPLTLDAERRRARDRQEHRARPTGRATSSPSSSTATPTARR